MREERRKCMTSDHFSVCLSPLLFFLPPSSLSACMCRRSRRLGKKGPPISNQKPITTSYAICTLLFLAASRRRVSPLFILFLFHSLNSRKSGLNTAEAAALPVVLHQKTKTSMCYILCRAIYCSMTPPSFSTRKMERFVLFVH